MTESYNDGGVILDYVCRPKGNHEVLMRKQDGLKEAEQS